MSLLFKKFRDADIMGVRQYIEEGRHLLLIAFLVIVVQGSDVLQYIWGKLLGKHKPLECKSCHTGHLYRDKLGSTCMRPMLPAMSTM